MDEPTPRQLEIYTYLFEQTRKTGVQPSFREVCAAFGYHSTHSVTLHLRALAQKGWVVPPSRGSRADFRSVRFLRTPSGMPFHGFSLPGGDYSLASLAGDDPLLRNLAEYAHVILLALGRLRRKPRSPWADADLMCARREWDRVLTKIVAGLPPAYEPNGKAPVKI